MILKMVLFMLLFSMIFLIAFSYLEYGACSIKRAFKEVMSDSHTAIVSVATIFTLSFIVSMPIW